MDRFLNSEMTDKPMLFEVFTETEDESNALEMVLNTMVDTKAIVKGKIKNVVKTVVGETGITIAKKVLKKE